MVLLSELILKIKQYLIFQRFEWKKIEKKKFKEIKKKNMKKIYKIFHIWLFVYEKVEEKKIKLLKNIPFSIFLQLYLRKIGRKIF